MSPPIHNGSPCHSTASVTSNTILTTTPTTTRAKYTVVHDNTTASSDAVYVNDGRERLVRNRLRWLEGNWDGKDPPPNSPPIKGGPQALCDRRRVTRGRGERAPRWDSQLVPQNAALSVSRRRRWRRRPRQQQQHIVMDSASRECFALDRLATVARVSTSVSSASSPTDGVRKQSEEVGKTGQATIGTSNGGAIPLSDGHDGAVVRLLSGSNESGSSVVDCGMVIHHHDNDLSSSSAPLDHPCTNPSMLPAEGAPRSDKNGNVPAERGGVLVCDGLTRSLVYSRSKTVEEETSSPRVVGADEHLIVPDIETTSGSSGADSDDEATSFNLSPTQPHQLVTQPVVGGVFRGKPQREERRLEEVTTLLRKNNHWKLRAIRAENDLASLRKWMANSENIFGFTSPISPAKSTVIQRSHSTSEDGPKSSTQERFGDGPRLDSSSASKLFPCCGERSNNNSAGSEGSSTSFPGKASNGGEVTPSSSLGSRTRTKRNHITRNEDSGGSDGCDYFGCRNMHSYFGDEKPLPKARRRQEMDCVKYELRKAEIRQAAAEATVTSMLQRARAAELSRDVKEIQIRNLEARLALSFNNDSLHGDKYEQRQGRQHTGDGNCAKNKHHCFRRHKPFVEEQSSIPWQENTDHLLYSTATATAGHQASGPSSCPLSASSASLVSMSGPSLAIYGADGAASEIARAAGSETPLRELESQFRQRWVVFGARVAKASGVVVDSAKEAAQLTAAGRAGAGSLRRGGGGGAFAEEVKKGIIVPSKVPNDDNQTRTDSTIDEYWGSDHCTSA